jgi:hypothetical protein
LLRNGRRKASIFFLPAAAAATRIGIAFQIPNAAATIRVYTRTLFAHLLPYIYESMPPKTLKQSAKTNNIQVRQLDRGMAGVGESCIAQEVAVITEPSKNSA